MESMISNIVIIAIIAVILVFAVRSTIKHFKGQGDCCGGGSSPTLIKPRKLDSVIAEKTVKIDGMVCDNCAARVHNALNTMEGVNAKVKRSRGVACIRLGGNVSDAAIRDTIEKLGYKVTEII